MSDSLLSAQVLAQLIGNTSHDVFVRQTIGLDVEIDFPNVDTVFSNELNDPLTTLDDVNLNTNRTEYGWRAWEDPSQSDLDNDLKSPNNLWVPVFGEFTPIEVLTSDNLKKIQSYQDNKLMLNTGVEVEKFNSTWSEFSELSDIFIERIFDGNELSKIFSIETEDSYLVKDRVFVYVDGILQPTSNFLISKLTVSINLSIKVGAKIVVIYKKYQPTSEELSFDPETKDDILVNTQYKYGYDYTSFEIRDTTDRLSSSKYYFWVKNKNTPSNGKGMSVLQTKNLLVNGPSLYMAFHNIIGQPGQPLPIRYDAITIFGLNKYVSRDDTYKIRFTRNFTLRDDPNELDLKNIHAEWSLLRPSQNSRIPLNLWDKLVESAIGSDAAGNVVPFTYLADYDRQHGTSNRFGLGVGQILAEKEKVISSIKHTILNTKLTIKIGQSKVPDYIQNLKLTQLDKYFDTPENIRKTLDFIWREAKPKQINEIFFAVINDALANNFEFKDVFKTSRLSVYSIKTVGQILTGSSDE